MTGIILLLGIIGISLQPGFGLTPAADLTGTWNGSFQIDIDDGGDKICSFSGTINLKLQQSGTSLSGNYDYSVTNTQNYHPEWGIDCSLAFSGSVQGSVDGSRITLFFDSWGLSGSFTTNLINVSMSEYGVKASVSLSSAGSGTQSGDEEPEHEQTVEAYYDEYKEKSIQYLKEGNFKSALTYFEKLIGLVPEDYFGWYGKGIALSALGQYSQAIDNLNKSLERNPTKSDVWKAVGDAYYKLNDCDNAYKYYSNAVKYNPTNSGLKTYQSVAEKCAQQQENEQDDEDESTENVLDSTLKKQKELETFTGSNFVGKKVVADTDFIKFLNKINQYAKENNVKVHVTHSFREAKQSLTGTVVEPASNSNHLIGHAIDFNLWYGNNQFCNSKCLSQKNLPEGVKGFIEALRKDPNLRWGGDFKTKSDPIHIDDNYYLNDKETWRSKYDQLQSQELEKKQDVKEKVPGWIKNNAKWWSQGQIADSDFTSGIQHMIKEKIINIPDLPEQVPATAKEQVPATAKEQVPDWIRNNAGWWADGLISEDDFVNGIKYLVEKGIIRV